MKENQELEASDIAEQELEECWLYIKKNKKGDVKVKCIDMRENI